MGVLAYFFSSFITLLLLPNNFQECYIIFFITFFTSWHMWTFSLHKFSIAVWISLNPNLFCHVFIFFRCCCCRWFCHFDDDNYVNIPKLVELLSNYSPTMDWYLGKPSIASPLEIYVDNVSMIWIFIRITITNHNRILQLKCFAKFFSIFVISHYFDCFIFILFWFHFITLNRTMENKRIRKSHLCLQRVAPVFV